MFDGVFRGYRLLVVVLFLIILTVTFGIVMTPLEQGLDPTTKFATIEDGLWFAVTTVTGVGFGDYVPKTTQGRIIGVVLETIGVTFFGLVIAFLTINLLRKEQQFYWQRTMERFDEMDKRLERIEHGQSFSLNHQVQTKKSVSPSTSPSQAKVSLPPSLKLRRVNKKQ
ncbi:hypothetical protein A3A66_03195 [Microgenomates group bacterium RIFCSPLOWO2_01_FULL_46_13]|nr:MAG: hypothetical protein A2783_04810 [Microgenomates group bacterium RIFCSPHIGHO2_01_FULL_45_11]OGV94158.1 MAG: hypothetical protein A3A66_03195 [Microgenomates group bacterium RIFCSPLOWO2_01_FULL_46_13]